MTDTLFKIGKLIPEGDEPGRDAVHIAVVPMVAGCELMRGRPVTIVDGKAFDTFLSPIAPKAETGIHGYVDPYLWDGPIGPGDRFWMFMPPATVQDLRHEWTHPAIDKPVPEVADLYEKVQTPLPDLVLDDDVDAKQQAATRNGLLGHSIPPGDVTGKQQAKAWLVDYLDGMNRVLNNTDEEISLESFMASLETALAKHDFERLDPDFGHYFGDDFYQMPTPPPFWDHVATVIGKPVPAWIQTGFTDCCT